MTRPARFSSSDIRRALKVAEQTICARARHFVTGLLGKARTLFHGFGPKGEYPSRIDPAHEFEPFCISGVIKDRHGTVLGRSTRRGRICGLCGVTDVIGDLPCVPGKYFSK